MMSHSPVAPLTSSLMMNFSNGGNNPTLASTKNESSRQTM
jgi:hypothetical protein